MKQIILSIGVGLIDDLSVTFYPYHFVRTILSVPFCPIPFCPYTILSMPFCPHHFLLEPFLTSVYILKFHDHKSTDVVVVVENRQKSLNLEEKARQELNKNKMSMRMLEQEHQRLIGMKVDECNSITKHIKTKPPGASIWFESWVCRGSF